jgi:hypothetical protein
MYASPVSLLRLPPPRRRVNRGKFAPAQRGNARQSCSCGAGTAASALLRSRDARQSCSCGAGTPGGDSLVDFGRSEREGDPLRIAPAGV